MQKLFQKSISLLLALGLTFSCCACGNSVPASSEEVSVSSEEVSVSPEVSSPEISEDTALLSSEESEFSGVVLINEVMADNKATLCDSDGEYSDWLELYNAGSSTVDLTGWCLSDKEDSPGWQFPDVSLPAGSFLIVFASGKDLQGSELHTDFSLSKKDVLVLRDSSEKIVAQTDELSGKADVSVTLQSDGSYEKCFYPTPGFSNDADGFSQFQNTLTASGPLVINEVVVYSPVTYYYDNALSGYDWVEIKNISSQPVDLQNYALSDKADNLQKAILPSVTLQPGELVVFVCSKNYKDSVYSSLPLSLDSENERLYLSASDGTVIDAVSLKNIPYDGSYGRMDGENGFFYFSDPTPDAANENGARRVSASPTVSEPDGVFNDVSSVIVTLNGSGSVYYTTDGSLPTTESNLYDSPLELTETTVIRAINVEEDALPSAALSLSYIINENLTLPVASLVTDSISAYNVMYYTSEKGLELPGSLSYYDENGSFTAGCGVRMHGDTSLELDKKSLSVNFRGVYGSSSVDYDIFGGGVSEFSALLLRAGQDYYSTIVRDELGAELCRSFSDAVPTQRSQYCILFVNGVYSGIYALKEKSNEDYYASWAGVSSDSVETVDVPASMNSSIYTQVFTYCLKNDMSQAENYAYFCELMDVDNLIDWIIIEGYTGNTDLFSGNLRYVRSTEGDGKWRIMLYDLDSTFYSQSEVFTNLLGPEALVGKQIGLLLDRLMDNEDFCDALLTRAGQVLSDQLSDQNTLQTLQQLVSQIDAEVDRDVTRYGWTANDWRRSVEYLEGLLSDGSWHDACITNLRSVFHLSAEQQAYYFG